MSVHTIGWKALVEAAQAAYWQARRNDANENSALLAALDVAVGLATEENPADRAAE